MRRSVASDRDLPQGASWDVRGETLSSVTRTGERLLLYSDLDGDERHRRLVPVPWRTRSWIEGTYIKTKAHRQVDDNNQGRTAMDSTIGRRELLVRTGIAGAGALSAVALGSSTARAAGEEHELGPVGSWLVTVQRAGGVTLYDLVALAADGVLIESDLGGAKTTAGMGEWQPAADHTYRSTFSKLFTDAQGHLLKLTVIGTFSMDGPDSLSGSGSATAENFPGGGVVVQTDQTIRGVRIAFG